MSKDADGVTSDVRFELADLVAAYARNVDRRDYASLVALFANNAKVGIVRYASDPDGPIEWKDSIPSWAEGIRHNHLRYRCTTHFMGQQTVAAEKYGASGQSYCLAHHLYEDDGTWMNRVMGIRYDDKFTRRGGRWHFLERRVLIDWTESLLVNCQPTPEGWIPVGRG
jgi:hypothetical protein